MTCAAFRNRRLPPSTAARQNNQLLNMQTGDLVAALDLCRSDNQCRAGGDIRSFHSVPM